MLIPPASLLAHPRVRRLLRYPLGDGAPRKRPRRVAERRHALGEPARRVVALELLPGCLSQELAATSLPDAPVDRGKQFAREQDVGAGDINHGAFFPNAGVRPTIAHRHGICRRRPRVTPDYPVDAECDGEHAYRAATRAAASATCVRSSMGSTTSSQGPKPSA